MSTIVNDGIFAVHVPIILRNGVRDEIHIQPKGRVTLPLMAKLAPEAANIPQIRELGASSAGKIAEQKVFDKPKALNTSSESPRRGVVVTTKIIQTKK